MVQIYRNKNYCIYSNKNGAYIVHNRNKEFSDGHTHLSNYNTAKYIINLSLHKSIPDEYIGEYLLESLIRVSDDENYTRQIKNIKEKGCRANAPQRQQQKCSKRAEYRKSNRR